MFANSAIREPFARQRAPFSALLWLCSLLLLCPFDDTQAAIYACVVDGSTEFQDRPCPRKEPEQKSKPRPKPPPLGIHPSWFETPSLIDGQAFCDRKGCECRSMQREYATSLAQAVADSMYMDTSWHHFEQTYNSWLYTPTDAPELTQRHNDALDAACDVMMSQRTLKKFADEVLATLKKMNRHAENRGYDVSAPCANGDTLACEYLDAVQLFRQIKADAAALKAARYIFTSSAELPLDQ